MVNNNEKYPLTKLGFYLIRYPTLSCKVNDVKMFEMFAYTE